MGKRSAKRTVSFSVPDSDEGGAHFEQDQQQSGEVGHSSVEQESSSEDSSGDDSPGDEHDTPGPIRRVSLGDQSDNPFDFDRRFMLESFARLHVARQKNATLEASDRSVDELSNNHATLDVSSDSTGSDDGADSHDEDDDDSLSGSSLSTSSSSSEDDESVPLSRRFSDLKAREKAGRKRMQELLQNINQYKQFLEEEKQALKDELASAKAEGNFAKDDLQAMRRDFDELRRAASLAAKTAEEEKVSRNRENIENLQTLVKELTYIEEVNSELTDKLEEETSRRKSAEEDNKVNLQLLEELQSQMAEDRLRLDMHDTAAQEAEAAVEAALALGNNEKTHKRTQSGNRHDGTTVSREIVLSLQVQLNEERLKLQRIFEMLGEVRVLAAPKSGSKETDGMTDDEALLSRLKQEQEDREKAENEASELKATIADNKTTIDKLQRRIRDLIQSHSSALAAGAAHGSASHEVVSSDNLLPERRRGLQESRTVSSGMSSLVPGDAFGAERRLPRTVGAGKDAPLASSLSQSADRDSSKPTISPVSAPWRLSRPPDEKTAALMASAQWKSRPGDKKVLAFFAAIRGDARVATITKMLKKDKTLVTALEPHTGMATPTLRTALHVAGMLSLPNIVETLLTHATEKKIPERCEVNAVDALGLTPLHVACQPEPQVDNTFVLVALLAADGVQVNVRDHLGRIPLHYLAQQSWATEHLINKFVVQGSHNDVNAQDTKGKTALHLATQAGNLIGVRALLKHFAQLGVPDEDGNTPLHFASRMGLADVVALLLKSGADPLTRNLQDETANDVAPPAVRELLRPFVDRVRKTELTRSASALSHTSSFSNIAEGQLKPEQLAVARAQQAQAQQAEPLSQEQDQMQEQDQQQDQQQPGEQEPASSSLQTEHSGNTDAASEGVEKSGDSAKKITLEVIIPSEVPNALQLGISKFRTAFLPLWTVYQALEVVRRRVPQGSCENFELWTENPFENRKALPMEQDRQLEELNVNDARTLPLFFAPRPKKTRSGKLAARLVRRKSRILSGPIDVEALGTISTETQQPTLPTQISKRLSISDLKDSDSTASCGDNDSQSSSQGREGRARSSSIGEDKTTGGSLGRTEGKSLTKSRSGGSLGLKGGHRLSEAYDSRSLRASALHASKVRKSATVLRASDALRQLGRKSAEKKARKPHDPVSSKYLSQWKRFVDPNGLEFFVNYGTHRLTRTRPLCSTQHDARTSSLTDIFTFQGTASSRFSSSDVVQAQAVMRGACARKFKAQFAEFAEFRLGAARNFCMIVTQHTATLKQLCTSYLTPLLEEKSAAKRLSPELASFFKMAKTMYEHSLSFETALTKRMSIRSSDVKYPPESPDGWYPQAPLAPLLEVSLVPTLTLYERYVKGYFESLTELQDKNFSATVSKALHLRDVVSTLRDWLFTPVAHIGDLSRVVTDLLHATHPALGDTELQSHCGVSSARLVEGEYDSLVRISARIRNVAFHVRDDVESREQFDNLQRMQRLLTGSRVPDLVQTGRVLLREGFLCRKEKGGTFKGVYVALMSDAILFGTPQAKLKTVKFEEIISLSQAACELYDDPQHGYASGEALIIQTPSAKVAVVGAPVELIDAGTAEAELRSWLADIQTVVSALDAEKRAHGAEQKNADSACVRACALRTLANRESETRCAVCWIRFGKKRKRYSCDVCSSAICSSCSGKNSDNVRACKNCSGTSIVGQISILSLNDAILARILSCLDLTDILLRCSLCCRRWNRVVVTQSIWRQFYLRRWLLPKVSTHHDFGSAGRRAKKLESKMSVVEDADVDWKYRALVQSKIESGHGFSLGQHPGHAGAVLCISQANGITSSESTIAVTGGVDKALRIWNLSRSDTGIDVKRVGELAHPGAVSACDISFSSVLERLQHTKLPPGRMLIATACESEVRLFRTECAAVDSSLESVESILLATHHYHDECVTCVKICADRDWVVSSSADGSICVVDIAKVWNARTSIELGLDSVIARLVDPVRCSVNSFAFDLDGRIVAGSDKGLRLWSPARPESVVAEIATGDSPIRCVAFDRGSIFVGSDDGSIRVYSNIGCQVLSDCTSRILSICTTEGHLFAATTDERAGIWSLGDLRPVNSLHSSPNQQPLRSIATGADGVVISGHSDGSICVYDFAGNVPRMHVRERQRRNTVSDHTLRRHLRSLEES